MIEGYNLFKLIKKLHINPVLKKIYYQHGTRNNGFEFDKFREIDRDLFGNNGR